MRRSGGVRALMPDNSIANGRRLKTYCRRTRVNTIAHSVDHRHIPDIHRGRMVSAAQLIDAVKKAFDERQVVDRDQPPKVRVLQDPLDSRISALNSTTELFGATC